MAGSLKTEAVVLRSIRYGEADRILHLYTPERGRLSAIAKGVRRAKSRFGGRLEPCFRLHMVLHEGRSELLTVTAAETVAGHPRLREHGAALDGAARACDAVGRMFADGEPHRGVFNLLCNQLALLDAQPGARDPRQRARLPAQAAAGRGLRAAALLLRGLRGGRAPRRLLGRGRRRRLLGLRGELVRARAGRARLPRRRARPPAGRGAGRAGARAGPGRAGDPRHAGAPRAPAPAAGRGCDDLCVESRPPARPRRRVRMWGR